MSATTEQASPSLSPVGQLAHSNVFVCALCAQCAQCAHCDITRPSPTQVEQAGKKLSLELYSTAVRNGIVRTRSARSQQSGPFFFYLPSSPSHVRSPSLQEAVSATAKDLAESEETKAALGAVQEAAMAAKAFAEKEETKAALRAARDRTVAAVRDGAAASFKAAKQAPTPSQTLAVLAILAALAALTILPTVLAIHRRWSRKRRSNWRSQ